VSFLLQCRCNSNIEFVPPPQHSSLSLSLTLLQMFFVFFFPPPNPLLSAAESSSFLWEIAMKVVARGPASEKLQDLKLSQDTLSRSEQISKRPIWVYTYTRKEERALATTPPVGFAMVPPSPSPRHNPKSSGILQRWGDSVGHGGPSAQEYLSKPPLTKPKRNPRF